jgi:hypothetical protein
MDFPPHLLDELARVFARVALDRLLKDALALNQEHNANTEVQHSAQAASTAKNSPPCDGHAP